MTRETVVSHISAVALNPLRHCTLTHTKCDKGEIHLCHISSSLHLKKWPAMHRIGYNAGACLSANRTDAGVLGATWRWYEQEVLGRRNYEA